MNIKIFVDGPTFRQLADLYPQVAGVTYNPTLMKKLGAKDYKRFALDAIGMCPDKPISFEVLADDVPTMIRQAIQIAGWGDNVYVKIPIVSQTGAINTEVLAELCRQGVKLNVTAITTGPEAMLAANELAEYGGIVSIFSGRISDTGRDVVPFMTAISHRLRDKFPSVELLWASTREVFNLYQAEKAGCAIITMSPELLAKIPMRDKDLMQLSIDTVKQFVQDGRESGLSL